MSKLETNTIDTISGSTNLTLGGTNATDITIPSGVTITNNGTQSGFGGANTPAFEAFLSANQTVSDNTETKAQVNTEVFDTDGCYDNSTNYRFTPTVAGKYFVYARVAIDEAAGNTRNALTMIYKNGSEIARSFVNFHGGDGEGASPTVTAVIDMNGSSDYIELYGVCDTVNGSDSKFQGATGSRYTNFGAYKLIGV